MFLARARVTALLSGTFTEGITLVVAPPGFGKTTALRDFLTGDPNVAWVSLAGGAGVETFVRDLMAAIDPKAIRTVGALFEGQTAPNFEQHASAWTAERLRSFDGTIVLDDLHRVGRDRDVMKLLTHLVVTSHERIRWIFASRDTPHLPMGTWIARGWMALPVTESDLAFDGAETAELAKILGVAIPAIAVETIVADTQGWPIGIRLSLDLFTRNRELRPIKIRTRKVLFDYIDSEMWSRLTVDQQSLLGACALQAVPAVEILRDAGFGDVETALDELVERVPFLRSNNDGTYALHDLFREFVIGRLRRNPQLAPDLSQRLASVLTARGRFSDALQLVVATNRQDDIRRLLALGGFDLLETGHRKAVTDAIAAIAPADQERDAVAIAIRAALSFSDGSGRNAEALYRRALKLGVPGHMKWEVTRRLANIYLARGDAHQAIETLAPLVAQRKLTNNQAVDLRAHCAAAFAHAGRVDESNQAIAFAVRRLEQTSPATRARVLQQLGFACAYTGDLQRSIAFSRDATILATEIGLDAIAAGAFSTLYFATALTDDNTQRADFYNRQLIAAAERAGNITMRVHGLRSQLMLAATAGNVADAESAETALSHLTDARTYRDLLPTRQCRSLVHIAQGNMKAAWADLRDLPDDGLSAPERAYRDAFLAIVLLLNDRRDDALALVERPFLVEADGDTVSRRYLSLAFAFRSVVLWALERPAQARRALAFDSTLLTPRDQRLVEAITMLINQPFPIPNADAATDAYAMLEAAGLAGYAIALRRLVTRSAAEVELTPAELEILRAFHETGGRAADVATILHKSRYTVQNHVQSAIRKIGCSGRSEALAYARKRGWLDGP